MEAGQSSGSHISHVIAAGGMVIGELKKKVKILYVQKVQS